MTAPLRRPGAGWLGAVVALGLIAALAFTGRVLHAPLEVADDAPRTTRGPRGFPRGWQRDGDLRWNVVSERSAHHALMVRVEMTEPERAHELAERLVDASRDDFEEILVYVYRPAAGSHLAERRVRWTRATGLDELVLLPVPRPALR